MNKSLAAIVVLLLCTSCAPSEVFTKSEQTIADQGYSQIQYEGWAWFSCGEEDQFALKYSAIARSGRPVILAVCSGWFKGVTLRTIK